MPRRSQSGPSCASPRAESRRQRVSSPATRTARRPAYAAGALHLAQGKAAVASSIIRRRLRELDEESLEGAALVELLTEVEVARGAGEEAARLAQRLAQFGSSARSDLIVGRGERALGRSRLASGDPPAATSHLEHALATFSRASEMPLDVGRTWLLLRRVLAEGEQETAIAEAQRRARVLRGAGRCARRRRCSQLPAFARREGRARAGPKGVGLFTKREHEVLGLLGEGLSNPDIAKRLFISRKTVEHHVASVLSELSSAAVARPPPTCSAISPKGESPAQNRRSHPCSRPARLAGSAGRPEETRDGQGKDGAQRVGDHAVVIGASVAGLLAARVLSDAYERVTIIERDELPVVGHGRKAVPQGRHAHVMLASGQRAIEELLPGITDELLAAGAKPSKALREMRSVIAGHLMTREAQGADVLLASRPLIEGHIRRRVLALANVTVRQRCDVVGLLTSPDRRRATGVRVRDNSGERGDEALDCRPRRRRAERPGRAAPRRCSRRSGMRAPRRIVWAVDLLVREPAACACVRGALGDDNEGLIGARPGLPRGLWLIERRTTGS